MDVLGEFPIDQSFALDLTASDDPAFDLKTVTDNVGRAIGKIMITKGQEKPLIEYDDRRIVLTWKESREATSKISNKLKDNQYKVSNLDLRYYCNSAHNVDERTGKRIIKREDIPVDIQATQVDALGNYAFSVQWSDGHSSIFPYEYFIKLATDRVIDGLEKN